MNALYFILQFVIAGFVVVLATVLSRLIDPRWGGLIAAAPHILTLSIIFVFLGSGVQKTQGLIVSAAWFVVPVFAFLAMVYILLPKIGIVYSIASAYLVYFALALILNFLVNR